MLHISHYGARLAEERKKESHPTIRPYLTLKKLQEGHCRLATAFSLVPSAIFFANAT